MAVAKLSGMAYKVPKGPAPFPTTYQLPLRFLDAPNYLHFLLYLFTSVILTRPSFLSVWIKTLTQKLLLSFKYLLEFYFLWGVFPVPSSRWITLLWGGAVSLLYAPTALREYPSEDLLCQSSGYTMCVCWLDLSFTDWPTWEKGQWVTGT